MSRQPRFIEKMIATMSFIVAAALAFVSMIISTDNDVQANTLLAIAQFLTLCATILGIDYKFTHIPKNNAQINTNPEVNSQA